MKKLRQNIFYFSIKWGIFWLVKLIWIKKIKGKENLPAEGAYIIASNHQSFFDFLSLVAVFDRKLTFLAAEKFWDSWFWYPLMEYSGQIKVDRKNDDKEEVRKKALAVLGEGRILGIFPQGTRSRNGQIEKTFSGVADFALAAKVPIVPVGIKGAFRVMAPGEKKPKFKKIIEIKIGEPFYLEDYKNKKPDKKIYREMTNKLMIKIAELSGKILL